MPRLAIPLLSALVLTVLTAAPAAAQSVWLDRDHRSSVFVEALFPDLLTAARTMQADSSFPTWTWFVGARVPVSRTVWLEAELPYTRIEFDSEFIDITGSKIGNPYVGVEVAPNPDRGMRFEVGLRAPVVNVDDAEDLAAVFNGVLTDVDRRDAFYPDILPVHTGIRYHQSALTTKSGVGFDIRLTPDILIPVGDNDGDTEVELGYLGTVQYAMPSMRVGAGFTGAWIATGDQDFDQDSSHQLEFMADFLKGSVRPGVQLKIPLDSEPFDIMNLVWGFSLNILPGHSGQ